MDNVNNNNNNNNSFCSTIPHEKCDLMMLYINKYAEKLLFLLIKPLPPKNTYKTQPICPHYVVSNFRLLKWNRIKVGCLEKFVVFNKLLCVQCIGTHSWGFWCGCGGVGSQPEAHHLCRDASPSCGLQHLWGLGVSRCAHLCSHQRESCGWSGRGTVLSVFAISVLCPLSFSLSRTHTHTLTHAHACTHTHTHIHAHTHTHTLSLCLSVSLSVFPFPISPPVHSLSLFGKWK